MVVIGSGFAGLWAALGAARRLDELAVPAGTVDVMVVSNKPFHDIRVRNYEADLSACRIPLGDVLGPAGVAHVTAEVTAIDADGRRVTTSTGASYSYDRLVLASGSHVVKPALPGLAEFGFDVDTYDGAVRLQQHLARTGRRAADIGGGNRRGRRCRADRYRDGLRVAGPTARVVRPW
ncbi:FAD-dependent oxidoreductase [Mycobacterium tuberculosis]|uniref:FAD-dependent oxidoreductase n=1 Tax=Mycobacterium tuberculosis TaxID=1773 RepID=UPI0032B61E21